MRTRHHPNAFRPSLPFVLLCVLMGVLWITGGSSRGDVLGQVVVRSVAWILLVVAILFGERPRLAGAVPVLALLLAAGALALLQLVPLPPAIWQALPGRALLADAAVVSGQEQPWRPWSIVPGATLNAASSLIVPFMALMLVAGLKDRERPRVTGLLLGMVVASTLVGLLQFSGAGFDNPLINGTAGQVSGSFANRNHLALFIALGCLLAPAWAFLDGRRPGWRAPVAFGLVLLFVLVIVAIGSRAGLALGALALGMGMMLVRKGIRRELSRLPRWAFPALIAAIVGVIAVFVLVSVSADRAEAIDRALVLGSGQDMRRRGLPTVLAMTKAYFPVGSGLGGFDPVFRIHEPFALLKPTYFNHAHNDFVEIVLDAGLPGLLLLLCGLGWWAIASLRAWRGDATAPKLGSGMLLLVLVASAFDYPARTPVIMATIVLAGWWLSGGANRRAQPALPLEGQHL